MARDIAGMRILITGASSGIGEACIRECAARGARCLGMARREDRLQSIISSLPGTGHEAVVGDVSNRNDCERMIAHAQEHMGSIDTLVCNAGYGLFADIASTSRADWDAIMATNVHGTLNCIRAVLPIMKKQDLKNGWRGQIMIVSSILARRGAGRCGAYCASKAVQLSIAEALRVELREVHIAVTSVHPVGTKTEFFSSAAERLAKKADSRSSSFDQTPGHVAMRMRKAIQRPCPEVWPMRSSRWFAAWCTLFPRLADRIVSRLSPKDDNH